MRLKAVVQNTLADMQFPVPRVLALESDKEILSGPFTIMERIAGRPLGEGFGLTVRSGSLASRMRLLLNPPKMLASIIETWARADTLACTAGRTVTRGRESRGN
jgi:aminoglycoside phosphotransferase (APT) family kinase protein